MQHPPQQEIKFCRYSEEPKGKNKRQFSHECWGPAIVFRFLGPEESWRTMTRKPGFSFPFQLHCSSSQAFPFHSTSQRSSCSSKNYLCAHMAELPRTPCGWDMFTMSPTATDSDTAITSHSHLPTPTDSNLQHQGHQQGSKFQKTRCWPIKERCPTTTHPLVLATSPSPNFFQTNPSSPS